MNLLVLILVSATLLLNADSAFSEEMDAAKKQVIRSVYTDLSEAKCRLIMSAKETADSIQRCPGMAGYTLLLLDSDVRMSVTVVNRNGKQHPLNFWDVITHNFSVVGKKAEWRVITKNGKTIPIALIVRVNAKENPEAPDKVTPYLAVAKITSDEICVTDRIPPGPKMNEEARRAADSSTNKPCLKE